MDKQDALSSKMFSTPPIPKHVFHSSWQEAKDAEKNPSDTDYRPYTQLRIAEDISKNLAESFMHDRGLGWLGYDGMRYKQDAKVEMTKALMEDLKEKTVDAYEKYMCAQADVERSKNKETEQELKRAKAWHDLCLSQQNQASVVRIANLQQVHLTQYESLITTHRC
jgi:hypothetical protein